MSRAPFRCLAPALLALAVAGSAAAEPDRPGSADHPVLTRMQSMHIVAYRTAPFEKYLFHTGKARGSETPVEGRFFEIRYQADGGAQAPAPVAVLRNHQQAIRAVGGAVVYEDNRYAILKAVKDGTEIWVQVDTAWNRGYQLVIVEKTAMAQEVTADAEAFRAGLKTTGHVEVPGIYFDSGKSVLKEESLAALAEVAKLLQADPALKVFVVGHTDAQASVESNLKLSQARADAVVEALVARHRVAAARLRGFGAGPLAPVASNDSDAGRAKNRRVELVKQ